MINKIARFIPQLNGHQRRTLYATLHTGAICNVDFILMMCFSTALVSFGLLLNSVAIIIGAMLVAPLMTPLISSGCAIIRGNTILFRTASVSMVLGSISGLGISLLIGSVAPNNTLTTELITRGQPTIMDLLVALVAGAAAAYASARPKVLAPLVGVAIAAALVPPLATVGIALSQNHTMVAEGAAILFITNVVAIILGSAIMFRLMGISGSVEGKETPLLFRRALLATILIAGLLCVPLGYSTAERVRLGEIRPVAYPLTPKLATLIKERVSKVPDVDVIMAGRSSMDYTAHDTTIILSASKPVSASLKKDLKKIVKDFREKDVSVRVMVLQEAGWEKAPDMTGKKK